MEIIMAHLTINYKSSALNKPIMLDVLIPQGRGNYKVLYLLHGAGGDHSSWVLNTRIADYVNTTDIAVVMPSGNNRFYINNIHGKDYYTYAVKELITQCEQWFNISRDPKDRYIAGMSMGGYGAFYAALNNPSMYNTAFSYSGLLNILERYDNPQGIDMFPVFGSRDDLINNKLDLYSLIDAYAKENEKLKASDTQYNDTKFVITCGLQDPRIHMSCEFNNALSAAGINTSYYETDGGHNWEYWDRCIKNTIDYIYNAKGAEWRSLCR